MCVVDSLPPGPHKNRNPREVLRTLLRTLSLLWQEWLITIQRYSRTIKKRLAGELWSIPKIKTLFLVFGALCIPVLIAIGFGVQAVNPVTEAGHAMGWFTLVAIYAGVAVVVLEDIRPPKLWPR